MGFGSRRSARVPLLNARHQAVRLAWEREPIKWSVEDWKRIAWSDESRFHLLNADGRLRIWPQAHEELNPIEYLWDLGGQGGENNHTALTNITELWTASANIWQVIPVKRFQKLVETMPRRVAAGIKAREGPTHY
ncbi:transposable element Tc1 transposase [Trichonephila clavipes]|nr:transposable element Tc1 transposase [Trichonephila clavipes]